ncbi:unnamed protein product [Ixodes hexagonus]
MLSTEEETMVRRKPSREEQQAVSKRLFRRSTLLEADLVSRQISQEQDSSSDDDDDDFRLPRVVGIQGRPEGPIYELPPPPRKVPPPPPQRRDSLQAPEDERLLPPPSDELLLSDSDDASLPQRPQIPLPPKKHPKPGLYVSTFPPELTRFDDIRAEATSPRCQDKDRDQVVPSPSIVVLEPLSPGVVSSPRKKSATLGNFLETRDTTWKFQPAMSSFAGQPSSDDMQHLQAPLNELSSSDTDGSEEFLLPPPSVQVSAESSDSDGTIYEDIEPPVRPPSVVHGYSVATKHLVRPPKGKKFGMTLADICARKGPASVPIVELQEEGKNAIETPGSPTLPDLPPQDYILDEMEERAMIEPLSYEDPRLKELISVLIEWINDELASHRIIVKDIEEDLYDGQVLQKLLESLTGKRLDVVEVTQSEEGQKQKLRTVVDCANQVLGLPKWGQYKWSVESIHDKNIVSIIHLLVALARHFRAPVRLPENVVVNVVVVQKRNGILHPRTVQEELTSTYDDLGMRVERDAFDTLFDHAPDKLQVVKKSLMTFVNKHLNKINLEVSDLDTQFQDGIYLVLLMGLVEGYFVPLYSFFPTPSSFEQKVHNVAFAFSLMTDAGLPKPKARPEDLVNADLKSTLRVLYNLFTKYKDT